MISPPLQLEHGVGPMTVANGLTGKAAALALTTPSAASATAGTS